ncbi:MAG: hypothetical protein IKJ99_04265 [Oscillospiraceae bacterium]|nr:hypothetical protein [Oscillospiraceae bacterium]
MVQKLKDIYQKYDEEIRKVIAKAKPTDGLFGMGDDPRKEPCHMRFYEGVEQWVQDFLKTAPDAATALEAARVIIEIPASHREGPTYWFEYAAHGLCKDLIGKLDAAGCRELRDFYDVNYLKRDRMPVQAQIYKLLKKGAGKG